MPATVRGWVCFLMCNLTTPCALCHLPVEKLLYIQSSFVLKLNICNL